MRLARMGCLAIASAMLLILGNLSVASADIEFSVEFDPPVNAGDVATVNFFGASTGMGGAQMLSGVNLPVDFGGDGAGIMGGFNIVSANNPVNGNVSLNFATLQNGIANSDAIVNLNGGSVFTVNTTPTFLFDLSISTPTTAPVGSFPVDIQTGAFFTVTAADNSVLTASSTAITGGAVNIVAEVPEPSSIMLLVAGVSGLALRRRRII